MFENLNGQQTTMGATPTQNPSMLDNVSTQDFSGDDSNKTSTTPTTDSSSTTPQTTMSPPPAPDTTPTVVSTTPTPVTESSEETKPEPEHPITSDNPFIQSPSPLPANDDSDDDDSSNDEPPSTTTPTTTTDTKGEPSPTPAPSSEAEEKPTVEQEDKAPVSTSGPVQPPTLPDTKTEEPKEELKETEEEPESAKETVEPANTTSSVPEVDTKKLAGMKEQALGHLEPLVEHLDQDPEETFKTTMMMIQANDNHTLLEKALKAAKQIKDDKVRARAMLDIINEINYFSQLPSQD